MADRRWLILLAALAAACSGPAAREYELRGQVLAVDEARQEVTIRHEDIPQFMPGMTMAFKVRDGRLLAERRPGDLVVGTLVVEDEGVHLRRLERTGSAPVPENATIPARILEPGDTPADATLVDQSGVERRFSDWRGKTVAVTFTYTRCPLPDFCPLMERNFHLVQSRLLENERLRDSVALLSITVDPEHDTPPVLAAHAAAVRADARIWTFLTGAAGDVRAFAGQFGLTIVDGEGGGTEIVHNLRTAVIDREGRLSTILSGNDWKPDDLVAALEDAHERTPTRVQQGFGSQGPRGFRQDPRGFRQDPRGFRLQAEAR